MSYNNYYLACRFSVSAMALSIELEMAVAKELRVPCHHVRCANALVRAVSDRCSVVL
jgi:hypothetical protein